MRINLLCNENLSSSKIKLNNSLKSLKMISINNDLLKKIIIISY